MLHQEKNIKKLNVFIMVTVFLLVITYFTIYKGTHMIHDCTGEDCPICHELHIAEAFTKQILPAVIITAVCFFIAFFANLEGKVISNSVSERNLISDKVRIDD